MNVIPEARLSLRDLMTNRWLERRAFFCSLLSSGIEILTRFEKTGDYLSGDKFNTLYRPARFSPTARGRVIYFDYLSAERREDSRSVAAIRGRFSC